MFFNHVNVSFSVCGINKDLVLSCLVEPIKPWRSSLRSLVFEEREFPVVQMSAVSNSYPVRGADIPDYFLRSRSGRSHTAALRD